MNKRQIKKIAKKHGSWVQITPDTYHLKFPRSWNTTKILKAYNDRYKFNDLYYYSIGIYADDTLDINGIIKGRIDI